MTTIDIVSGFLGAGKTTLIKKLIAEAFSGQKIVLIENEFGEIGIDGGFLRDAGIEITEMNSGCICCSLVGDFGQALRQVLEQYHPDRILIEPSGVGKLSDVIVAVENTVADTENMKLNSFVTVADATKVKVYMKNFGEFYNNQIEAAGTIILSRTQKMSQEKLEAAVAMLREKNADAAILTTPWDQLDGKTILAAIEKVSLADELLGKMRAEHAADEQGQRHRPEAETEGNDEPPDQQAGLIAFGRPADEEVRQFGPAPAIGGEGLRTPQEKTGPQKQQDGQNGVHPPERGEKPPLPTVIVIGRPFPPERLPGAFGTHRSCASQSVVLNQK